MTDLEHFVARHDPELERQIAETMADRAGASRQFTRSKIQERAEMRYAVAKAVLVAMAGNPALADTQPWTLSGRAATAANDLVDSLAAAEKRDWGATP